MAVPNYPNTLANSTTADADEVNQNFTALVNSLTDGTKDLTVNQVNVSAVAEATANLTWTAVARATGTSVAARGIAISTSSGSYSTLSGTAADVTNLSVTIVTTGRPVVLMLVPDGAQEAMVGVYGQGDEDSTGNMYVVRDATTIASVEHHYAAGQPSLGDSRCLMPPPGVLAIDDVAAGTYTYKIQAKENGSNAYRVYYSRLVAYEL